MRCRSISRVDGFHEDDTYDVIAVALEERP
jgi:hypothetical protein